MRRITLPPSRARRELDEVGSRARETSTRTTGTLSTQLNRPSGNQMAVPLTRLAERLNTSPHQVAERTRYDKISVAAASSNPAPIQRVKGQNGLNAVMAAIHDGQGKAAPIARDIYNAEVGNEHDGDFETDTNAKIRTSLKKLRYGNTEAARLAGKQPFTREEIADNSSIGEGDQEYFLSSFDDLVLPPRSEELANHKLRFENTFRTDGTIVFKQNFRNAALAAFHASDVVEVQREIFRKRLGDGSQAPPAVTRLVRDSVISVTGQAWFERNAIRPGPLAQDLLDSFLSTENGKSSQRIAASMGKKVASGEVSGSAVNWSVTLHLEPANAGALPNAAALGPGNAPLLAGQQQGGLTGADQTSATATSGGGTATMTSDVQRARQVFGELKARFDEKARLLDPAIARTLSAHLDQMKRLLPQLTEIPELMVAFMRAADAVTKDLK